MTECKVKRSSKIETVNKTTLIHTKTNIVRNYIPIIPKLNIPVYNLSKIINTGINYKSIPNPPICSKLCVLKNSSQKSLYSEKFSTDIENNIKIPRIDKFKNYSSFKTKSDEKIIVDLSNNNSMLPNSPIPSQRQSIWFHNIPINDIPENILEEKIITENENIINNNFTSN